ncbi:hypothetical protein [Cytobacillus sp.]|uniref:hypothetical protein n=1 Tax=Cytobacillus sp. TaxID=2675269 RepID=UPI00351650AB
MLERIEGNYIIREYPSGSIVKTKISQDTSGEVIELPPNPLLEAQKKITILEQDLGNVLFESAADKAKISELETTQGDLLIEIAILKNGR